MEKSPSTNVAPEIVACSHHQQEPSVQFQMEGQSQAKARLLAVKLKSTAREHSYVMKRIASWYVSFLETERGTRMGG